MPSGHLSPYSSGFSIDTVRRSRQTWSTGDLGLPTQSVDLPVRSGGWLLGHFLLTPTPGKPVSPDRLLVAVTIADQVGAALAADESPDGSLASARLGPAPQSEGPP